MSRKQSMGLLCRYRSFTRHYFRKADGILVMYDVTSAHSFYNVRDWMTSIQVSVGSRCSTGNGVVSYTIK